MCGASCAGPRSRDLARVVAHGAPRPDWLAHMRRRPHHRLVLPMFDALGRIASFRFRPVRHSDDAKSVGPMTPRQLPFSLDFSGVVFACPGARRWLEDPHEPVSWWPTDLPVELWIVEGELDFLSYATAVGDADTAPLVVGVGSGSWDEHFAARLPLRRQAGVHVVIATHDDKDGDRYEQTIVRTLIEAGRHGALTWERRVVSQAREAA